MVPAKRPSFPCRAFLLSALLSPWLAACGDVASVEQTRDLSRYRVDQVPRMPGGLPPQWGKRFDQVLAQAPEVRLGEEHTLQVVHDLLTRIEWIDPRSIEVEMALPDGLRVSFRPRLPRLAIARGQRPVAILAQDGTLLPGGFSEASMRDLIFVSLDPERELPEVGKRPADPVLQEALRLWVEADTLAELAGLPIVAIQRRSDYFRDAVGIAPAMSFILRDGTEICWGRARDSVDPASVDSFGRKLTMERKTQRLKLVLAQYPLLHGVGRVVLDDPLVKVFDQRLDPLPLAGPIP